MILVSNRDVGIFVFSNDLTTSECLKQHITDHPDLIHLYHEQTVRLKDGDFVVKIDSWMDVELTPAPVDKRL